MLNVIRASFAPAAQETGVAAVVNDDLFNLNNMNVPAQWNALKKY